MIVATVLSAFIAVSSPSVISPMPATTAVTVVAAAEGTPRKWFLAWLLCRLSGNKFAFCPK
jgi:hypothetical protein